MFRISLVVIAALFASTTVASMVIAEGSRDTVASTLQSELKVIRVEKKKPTLVSDSTPASAIGASSK